jgi:hypothetical protein
MAAVFYFLFISDTVMATNPFSKLPRNMALTAFDPHRPTFECKIEATEVPPMDEQAQAWFDEANYITRPYLAPRDLEDYPKAIALLEKAAEKNHWKAMLNLASLHLNGAKGINRNTEKGVLIVEKAMQLGIPSAYDLMGTLHMKGQGVNQSADRAYAFWQLAADMGSASAQAFLGRSFIGGWDNPDEGIWANQPIAVKMMRCAGAQGNGKGATDLHSYYTSEPQYPAFIMQILHNAIKNGCADCRIGSPEGADKQYDHLRDDYYHAVKKDLDHNPDHRYPNLDKIAPFYPVPLKKFGSYDEAVFLAKGVQYPVITKSSDGKTTTSEHPRVTYGLDREIPYVDTSPNKLQNPPQPPFAAANAPKLNYLTSKGDQPAPEAGVWRVSVDPSHPLAHVLNRSWAAPNQGQMYLYEGQPVVA